MAIQHFPEREVACKPYFPSSNFLERMLALMKDTALRRTLIKHPSCYTEEIGKTRGVQASAENFSSAK